MKEHANDLEQVGGSGYYYCFLTSYTTGTWGSAEAAGHRFNVDAT